MATVFCAVAISPESASNRGPDCMRVGIIGVGMTAFRPSTPEYSWKELMFEAASRAYADAGVGPRTEVDSFVTCAEDYYEGFGIFDEFTPDQLGGALRPVCTVTGDGLQGLANAFMQIQTGLIDIAVVEAHSKASDILTLEGIIEHGLDPIWNKPLGGHPFLIAGLEADAFVRKTRTSVKAFAAVVAKNRTNALRNPLAAYAAKVDAEQVLSSAERFAPLRALDIAASADGGVVLVLASEAAARSSRAATIPVGRCPSTWPAGRSDAGTSSRRLACIGPPRSPSNSGATPEAIRSTACASASRNLGGTFRPRRGRSRSWGSANEEGRSDRGRDDLVPSSPPGDGQGDVLRGDQDGPRLRGPDPGGHRHGRQRDRAGRVRRRPHERRIPPRRLRRLPEAVHARLHRRRDRRIQFDRGMVARGLGPRGRGPRRERGEDVLLPAAPAERLRPHLGPDPRSSAAAEPGVDLRDGDEPLHARPRREEGGHRPRRGEEQAQRGRASVRAACGSEDHGRRRAEQRGHGVAGPTARHQPAQRRGLGDRPRLGGFHPPAEDQGPRVDVRRRLVHRLHDVDRPRPLFPGVRRPGRADRLQARQDLGPAEGDRLRGAVRPLRLQGAPSPRGPAAREERRGPDPHPRGRHGAGRGPARLPFRRPDGRRQPDRRDDGPEDRGTLLAAHEPGRQAADPARGPHRRGTGLGGSHAVRLCGGDVVLTQRITKWPGVELSAADLNEGKVTQTRFRPNAKYAWSAGEAMSRFLAELQNGRLIARTCHSCKRILFPPRMFCEVCFRPTDE